MAFEDDNLERAYPYHIGLKAFGCGTVFCAFLGAGGVGLVQLSIGQAQNGWAGFIFLVGALLTLMGLLFVVLGVVVGLKEAIWPTRLRVTPASLLLPTEARGQPIEKDELGNPKQDGPRQHPEEIPFSAIRWVRREAGAPCGNDKLLIVHDLSPVTLELKQGMMRAADFDELETVLRAAIPEAFAPAPPVPHAPGPADGV
jgi:hypothetical protein